MAFPIAQTQQESGGKTCFLDHRVFHEQHEEIIMQWLICSNNGNCQYVNKLSQQACIL